MKRRDSGGAPERDRVVEPKAERDETMKDEAPLDTIDDDLRDFLAADLLDVQVDPAFKERLRRELWELVSRQAAKWRALRTASDGDEEA